MSIENKYYWSCSCGANGSGKHKYIVINEGQKHICNRKIKFSKREVKS